MSMRAVSSFVRRICVVAVLAATAASCFMARAAQQQKSAEPPKAVETSHPNANEEKPPEVRFQYGGNVAQAPLDFNGDEDFIPVQIDEGLPVLFLLNTASPASAIDHSKLQDIGVHPASVPIDARAAHVILGLPGLGIGMPVIEVRSFEAASRGIGLPVRGVLGMNILSRFVVEIDYDRLSVRLFDPNSFQYSGKGTSIPLTVQDGVPTIRVRADVPGEKLAESPFIIDTAFAGTIEFRGKMSEPHRGLFTHLKMRPSTIPVEGTGQPPLEARIDHLQIGPFDFDETIAEFQQPSDREAGPGGNLGVLGNEILRRFTVILDVPHQRLILEPGHSFNDAFDVDMSGLTLGAEGLTLKTIRVVNVDEHSPGHAAGVQKGDVIVGVQAEPAVEATLADLRALFRQPGKQVRLTLDRNGKMVDVTLKLKRQI